ncbi:GNAT family N-acetyltransferase [Shewanella colwelliana]|uniref:GNAT family N-acetyltransferase n=1 Tax=Shewanella colwelliana TaxID=23 RepID=UPI003CFBD8BF
MIPELKTPNMIISVLKPDDLTLLVKYQNENRKHFAKWEPTRSLDYYSAEETRKRINTNLQSFKLGTSVSLVAFNKAKTEIIALCTFSNIVYGVFQACNLGYSISEREQGKGLMFEMLESSINYLFTEYNLHRIMANYIPENKRSEKLLFRLGFEKEGLAKSYLKIAGKWQDHVLTSKISS